MDIDPAFREHLLGIDIEHLDRDPATIFGVWADGRLALTNRGWHRFAAENGSPDLVARWTLGTNVYEAVPEALRPFYHRAWGDALASGSGWSHRYECSSAEVFRDLHMVVQPVGRAAGLLVTNGIVVERAHDPRDHVPRPASGERYRTADGQIVQCAECRRVRSAEQLWRWDWVPEWVEGAPAHVVAALCERCFDHYYAVR